MIVGIRCVTKQLRKIGGNWFVISEASDEWTSLPIADMISCQEYFSGDMQVHYRHLRKLGKVVENIVVTDSSEECRNIYYFDYSGAKFTEN